MDTKRQRATSGRRPATSRRTSPRNRLSRADSAALEHLDRFLDLQRRREQLAAAVPPGIQTEKLAYADGTVLFRFSNELGDLGRLRIRPVPMYMAPSGGCIVNAEIFSDDPASDPHWDTKYTLFAQMVTLCISSLPGRGVLHPPLPPLAEAKEQRRLYLRFTTCRHTKELHDFANELSAQHYRQLLAGIQQAQVGLSDQDEAGLLQRIDEFATIWQDLHPGDLSSPVGRKEALHGDHQLTERE